MWTQACFCPNDHVCKFLALIHVIIIGIMQTISCSEAKIFTNKNFYIYDNYYAEESVQ